jgi:DNA-binding response OmpR family regulator
MSNLLLVDSDPEFRSLCTALLAQQGHHVTGLAELPPERPAGLDLLLLDPGEDVAAGMERARRYAREVPVLLLTGGVARTWGRSAISPDGSELRVLAKPFSASALLGAVDRMLARGRGLAPVTAPPAGAD